MGTTRTGFCCFGASGFTTSEGIWQYCAVALLNLSDGQGRLSGQVYSGPGPVPGAGLCWSLGGEITAIGLAMGRAEMGTVFS